MLPGNLPLTKDFAASLPLSYQTVVILPVKSQAIQRNGVGPVVPSASAHAGKLAARIPANMPLRLSLSALWHFADRPYTWL
jgi:hypothetical protein